VRKFDLNLQSFRDHFVEQEPLSNGMDPGVRHGYPVDGQPGVVDGGQERSLADKYFGISALNLKKLKDFILCSTRVGSGLTPKH